jgi:hypothetical protein
MIRLVLTEPAFSITVGALADSSVNPECAALELADYWGVYGDILEE